MYGGTSLTSLYDHITHVDSRWCIESKKNQDASTVMRSVDILELEGGTSVLFTQYLYKFVYTSHMRKNYDKAVAEWPE